MTLDEIEPEVWVQRQYPSPMHEAFIKDILAHLQDAVRRLVFADWLDEHGEEDYAQELRRGPMLTWRTASGDRIPIRYLGDSHLLNILLMGWIDRSFRNNLLKERRRRGLEYVRPRSSRVHGLAVDLQRYLTPAMVTWSILDESDDL